MRYKRSVVLLTAILICAFLAPSLFGADNPNASYRSYFKLNRAPKFAIPFEHGPIGGINKDDGPMMSLGYIPTSSPGFQAGLTTYEYQHNGSMGRQIAFSTSNNMVHFVWMAQENYTIPGDRHIRFQAYDTQDTPPDYTQQASGKNVTPDYSGYVSLDATSDGRASFACHSDPSGEHYYTYDYIDFAAGMGIFTELYELTPDTLATWYWEDTDGEALEVIWPQHEVHYGATETVQYCLSHIWVGAEDLILYRKVGTADWNHGDSLETLTDLGYLIVARQGTDSVAIVYSDDLQDSAEGSGGQVNLDAWYMLSTDQGATWPEKVCISNYTEDSLWRCFSDLAAVFSDEGTLHVLWAARELRDANTYENYKCRLIHWDNLHGASVVDEARYDMGPKCDPDSWNMYIAKMSISMCDGNIYAIYTKFGDLKEEGAMIDCSQGGFANGELYQIGSDDDGITWDLPNNLTNSRTPGCDSTECDSDHWSSMVRAGMVYDGVADTLDVIYMNDKDAGGIPQGSGTWCVNPVMHLRIPCREVAHMPKTSYEPNNFVDPIYTLPGEQLDTTMTILNIGNDPLNWSAVIFYVDGADWVNLGAMSGSIPPAPAVNYATIDVNLNYGSILTDWPTGWDAYIIITSLAPTSPDTIPIHLTVDSAFARPKADTLTSYVEGARLGDGKALFFWNTANVGDDRDELTLDIPRTQNECDTIDDFPNTDIWLFDASPMLTWLDGADTNAYTTVFTQLYTEPGTWRPQDSIAYKIDTMSTYSAPDLNKYRFRVASSDSVFGVQVVLSMPTDGVNDFVVARNRFMLWDATEEKTDVAVGHILDWDVPSDSSVNNFSGYLDTSFADIAFDGDPKAGVELTKGRVIVVWQQGAEYHTDNEDAECDINEENRYGGFVLLNFADTAHKPTAWSTENAPNQLGSGYDPAFLYDQMRIAETEMYSTDSAIDLHSGITYDRLTIGPGGTEIYNYSYALITTNEGWDDFIDQIKTAYAWAKYNEICVRAGDANLDDAVNVGDAVYMINYVFKSGPAPGNIDQGDANNDGSLNVGDAVYLINYVFKSGTPPVCGHANDGDFLQD